MRGGVLMRYNTDATARGSQDVGQGGGWVSRPKYDRRAAELKDGIRD